VYVQQAALVNTLAIVGDRLQDQIINRAFNAAGGRFWLVDGKTAKVECSKSNK
jgi:hypothetical protein